MECPEHRGYTIEFPVAANNSSNCILHLLNFGDVFIRDAVQQTVTVINSRPDDGASNSLGNIR